MSIVLVSDLSGVWRPVRPGRWFVVERYLLIVLLLVAVALRAAAADNVPRKVGEGTRFPIEVKGGQALRERLRLDLAAVRQALQETSLPEDERGKALQRADELALQVEALPADLPPGFRAIFPLNDLHASIYALNAYVLRAGGFPPLSAWTQNRWDPLFPMQAPAKPPKTSPKLNVAMMRREYRSEAFNLTNATDKPIKAHLKLTGLPGGDNPAWVSVREVLFTDTYVHFPIAAALPEARRITGGFEVTIPAGTTRQVWLTFHPTTQLAQTHKGRIVVTAKDIKPITIPLQVRLYPFDFPAELSIAVGGWDYSHDKAAARDAGILDLSKFVKFLRGYWVNTPWASRIPLDGCEFDADGHLTREPDYTVWDRWITAWKGARYYADFLVFDDSFFGEKTGTPRFKRMVGEWFVAWMRHAKAQGIEPGRILLLILDESRTPKEDAIIIPYAEAIKAVEPKALIYQDPLHKDPRAVDPRFYDLSDIISPMATRFVSGSADYRDFYISQKDAGRELWFYSCTNGKHLDPITYWRGQFWLAIQYGAKGSFYWSFGDEGRSGGSFNAYTSPAHMFCPFFIDREMGIIDGKHMQAIREGAEDYEYFAILRERVARLEAKGSKSAALQAAKKLLAEGPVRVTREISVERIEWDSAKNRAIMDEVRIKALDALSALGR